MTNEEIIQEYIMAALDNGGNLSVTAVKMAMFLCLEHKDLEHKKILEELKIKRIAVIIAILTILVENGKKGDMERIIKEQTAILEKLVNK